MPISGVIFDLDGTLLDTLADIGNSANAVLERLGYPQHPLAAYRYFVGAGVEELARRALPETARGDEQVAQATAAIRQEYSGRWADETRPYAGVAELLGELRRRELLLAVLSNKPQELTGEAVARLLGQELFQQVRGARPEVPLKPDPAAALEIARELQLQPAELLYVGDTAIDMQTARAAGMHPVGVLWGFRSAEELRGAGAWRLIEQPRELLPLLQEVARAGK